MASVTETITSIVSYGELTTSAMGTDMNDVMWMLVVGFITSFVLAFGLGANDVANSFATSVGAKVLTLREACVLASFFETAGAVLLGAKVSDTIRKGIFDVSMYEGQPELLMAGQVAALGGAMVWLLVATALKLPVSGTHSIVGAMLGFHLVVFQVDGVNWKAFTFIVLSWIASPILSGTVSAIFYIPFRKFVLSKANPLEPGLRALPLLYGLVVVINLFSIFYDGPELLEFDHVPLWGILVVSFGAGFLVGLLVWFVAVPRIRRKLQELKDPSIAGNLQETNVNMETKEKVALEDTGKEANEQTTMMNGDLDDSVLSRDTELNMSIASKETKVLNGSMNCNGDVEAGLQVQYQNGTVYTSTPGASPSPKKNTVARFFKNGSDRFSFKRLRSSESPRKAMSMEELNDPDIPQDSPVVAKMCSPLQVLSAIFASFAHGGNDVSNAIGPLIALWAIFQSGEVSQKQPTPVWILFYGGVGITVGLWILGRRVIETVGKRLTTITPSSGFTIELGAAVTVLAASNLGIPISTTHCKVGSVVTIGLLRNRKKGVEWKLFGSIMLGWIITLPVTAGVSALIMVIFQNTVL
ncbi:sodium-dependent phosphate transporter 1-B-like isoform X2 [Amphiura filiformis]|uniref:sodium-dependent phosphate transporter 1-B-like isoform X2 n=1 Tax=Amphiura filiformis TaxID=82378 RepID=UPI003B21C3FC